MLPAGEYPTSLFTLVEGVLVAEASTLKLAPGVFPPRLLVRSVKTHRVVAYVLVGMRHGDGNYIADAPDDLPPLRVLYD